MFACARHIITCVVEAEAGIEKYESWGGPKDGVWHGPAMWIYIGLSNPGDNKVHSMWLNDLTITASDAPAAK